jgi:hypothetical protein
MPNTLLNLPGKTTATNALVVVAGVGLTTGTVGVIGNLPVKVDSQNRLVVVLA